MPPDLTVITPVLPDRSAFLPAAGRSVRRAANLFAHAGLSMEWIVVIDGPGDLHCPEPDTGTVIRLPARCGVSAARNTALALAKAPWVFPLDADDETVPDGLLSLMLAAAGRDCTWAAGNRLLTDGRRTPHWFDEGRVWAAGELAAGWRSPFAFHPNSVLFQRDPAMAVGGWPAVPANEDMALVLAMSETGSGVSDPAVVTLYRPWDGQMVADPAYPEAKALSFGIIRARTDILRAAAGRPPASAPIPGGAHGVIPR